MNKIKLLTMLLTLSVSVMASAQNLITGTVTDESGEPLIGASLAEKGNREMA